MDPLLATGHLPLLLLVAGLFFPRLTLFFAWFFSAYPANALSDLLNFVLWLFVPRFLIAFYIYADIGTHNLWFWAYVRDRHSRTIRRIGRGSPTGHPAHPGNP